MKDIPELNSVVEPKDALDNIQKELRELQSCLYHLQMNWGYGVVCMYVEDGGDKLIFFKPSGYINVYKDSIKSITPVTDLHWTLEFLSERNRVNKKRCVVEGA